MKWLLSVGFAFCFPLNALADGWPEVLHKNVHRLKVPIGNPWVASARGTCALTPPFYKTIDGYQRRRVPSHLLAKPASIPFIYQLDQNNRAKRAPLVIYLAGAFGGTDTEHSRQLLEWFSTEGYHGIELPDPWSSAFIRSSPKTPMGHPVYEAQVLHSLIRNAVNHYKTLGILEGKPRLIGLSHGAFMATVVAALDAESENPIGFQDITALSPPYNLYGAAKNLDAALNESYSAYKANSLLSVAGKFLKICGSLDLRNPSSKRVAEAKMMAAWHAFQKPLVDSLYDFEKYVGLKNGPLPKYNPKLKNTGSGSERAVEKFRESIRFVGVVNKYFPETSDAIRSDLGKLSYWRARAEAAGFHDMRFLAAEDDFLNSPNSWQDKNDYDLLLIKSGGHYGYRIFGWFNDLLRLSFKRKNLVGETLHLAMTHNR